MKIIIGLGNSGLDYVNTRHNVGFMVIDALKKSSKYRVLKSTNFMNESGSFVKALYTKYNIQYSDLYIVHDDLDIPLGSYKIQLGHSPKDHNGIKSVDESLGTDQYWHVKVGVDNRMEEPSFAKATAGKEYVLQNFSEEEKVILDKVVKEVASKLKN